MIARVRDAGLASMLSAPCEFFHRSSSISFLFFPFFLPRKRDEERERARRRLERKRPCKKEEKIESQWRSNPMTSRLLLFDAQLCNTITPASRITVPLLRSCETRESRGRARLPVTAPCYSIFSVYDFPLLFTLKFESISRSGGIVGKRRIVVQVENLDLFESGSRKLSYCNEVLRERRERRYEQSWEQLDSLFPSLTVASSLRFKGFRKYHRWGGSSNGGAVARLEGILTFSSEIVAV